MFRDRCERGIETKAVATVGEAAQATGRIKEAAGSLTSDEGLDAEGKVDRRSGELREKVEDVIDKAKDTLHER